ncbi:MAG: hypothetical protein US13_C0009G0027 [candidate division TM6 bacterium GW2011_GWE2_36_25]|nr:MAG: hypothetical protein US03_C0015G0002 [candidate division TM6 bacterium GW2011_GWF2_36_131]KKQ02835.1 MAG: hypothetical protein US13_C0009G0027 [candidate division TM6 bacterium GW2011_GWE2_36_25]
MVLFLFIFQSNYSGLSRDFLESFAPEVVCTSSVCAIIFSCAFISLHREHVQLRKEFEALHKFYEKILSLKKTSHIIFAVQKKFSHSLYPLLACVRDLNKHVYSDKYLFLEQRWKDFSLKLKNLEKQIMESDEFVNEALYCMVQSGVMDCHIG